MADPKHTPGPWWAGERAPKHLGSVIAIMSSGTKVATGVAHAWTEADAALIAAAPELLAALKALDPHLDHIPGGIGGEIDDARAAIAKAEGR
jgi:hypothetical protein